MAEEQITRALAGGLQHWRKRLLSEYLALQPLVDAITDEQKHLKFRTDKKGNPLLFTRDGFHMVVYDNLDLLTRRSGLSDYSGGRRTHLVNEADEKEEFYLSDEFLDCAQGVFDKYKSKKDGAVTDDDDLKGNARDGALNQMLDRPRAEPFERTCKKVKVVYS